MGFGFWPFFLPWWGYGGQGFSRLCPKCAAWVPAGCRYCPYCGASMMLGPLSGPPCPKCEGPTVTGAPFCPHCSTEVAARVCKKCHEALSPTDRYCAACGASVS